MNEAYERTAYGPEPVPEVGEPLQTFKHGQGLGEVRLHQDPERDYLLWVSFPRYSLKKGEEGILVRVFCPYPEVYRKDWGKARYHQCHTKSRTHPWNQGAESPGSHRCGACGFFTWQEIHGVADGFCLRCGYYG